MDESCTGCSGDTWATIGSEEPAERESREPRVRQLTYLVCLLFFLLFPFFLFFFLGGARGGVVGIGAVVVRGWCLLPVSGPVAMAPPLSSASALSSSIFVAQVLAKSKSGRPEAPNRSQHWIASTNQYSSSMGTK